MVVVVMLATSLVFNAPDSSESADQLTEKVLAECDQILCF